MATNDRADSTAACTEAPCLQVNYRHRYRVTAADFDSLVDSLREGRADDVPAHGTLARVRQQIPADREVGAVAPEAPGQAPAWIDGRAAL